MLESREVAAFIMEPIAMNLGVLVPDATFMRELVPLCHRYGTLVIADEVACGFGRTGKLFACEHYDLAPDLMCLAKALTSGVAPLGAVLATAEIEKAAEGELSFYATFGWHPLAVEAGDRDAWGTGIATAPRSSTTSPIARTTSSRGSRCGCPRRPSSTSPGSRSRSTSATRSGSSASASAAGARACLIVPEEDTIQLFPALTIDRETLAEALDILDDGDQRRMTRYRCPRSRRSSISVSSSPARRWNT